MHEIMFDDMQDQKLLTLEQINEQMRAQEEAQESEPEEVISNKERKTNLKRIVEEEDDETPS